MRFRKFVYAVGVGIRAFAKRSSAVGTVIWLLWFCILICIPLWIAIDRWTETPEQARAREAAAAQFANEGYAAQQRWEAAEKADREKRQFFCKLKSICERYGQARQECATAGSFKHCVGVKMNDDNYEDIVGSCKADGHLQDASLEPGALDCLFSR